MPTYYKKASLGRMIEQDRMDSETVEVKCTSDEYSGLWQRINSAEYNLKKAKEDSDKEISKLKSDSAREIAICKRDCKKQLDEKDAEMASKVADLELMLEEAKSDCANARGLNENLLRIMRERANAKRGVSPKKEHNGYLVLDSREWQERYSVDVWIGRDDLKPYFWDRIERRMEAISKKYIAVEQKTAKTWRSTVQTPYDASLPIEQIKKEIEIEIFSIKEELAIDSMRIPEYNGIDLDIIWSSGEEENENQLYKWSYRANFKTGLWEVDIYTTKRLVVPEHRRSHHKN